ncbi:MAG: hypothetical protein JWS12_199 [Candidatus Saccharibacteria bacterium]|nr:hypothetical protein [Candidatus Saccharibacteria bacterium]
MLGEKSTETDVIRSIDEALAAYQNYESTLPKHDDPTPIEVGSRMPIGNESPLSRHRTHTPRTIGSVSMHESRTTQTLPEL